ncbi:pentapeptide repeat-containing protein [Ammonicoccus fulvus]|uniref:Pentapeptide repeat-containing protein n=1 Tax=Ammonicoccus fulvus TaxID=3138240 RepID=A0ABZ3FSU6_9ACTN
MRKRARRTPELPDLGTHLAEGPAEIGSGDRLEGLVLGATTQSPMRLHDLALVECRVQGMDLSGRRLGGFMARDVVFEGCDLAGTVLEPGGRLTRVRFDGCRLSGLVLVGVDLTDVVIEGGKADLANFRQAAATRLWGREVSLREADFTEAQLKDCAFLDCDLAGAEFRGATLSGVSLHGSAIEEIRSPSVLARGARIAPDQQFAYGQALLAEFGPEVSDRPDT